MKTVITRDLLLVAFILSPKQLITQGIKKAMRIRSYKDNGVICLLDTNGGVHRHRKESGI
jgi:hypothetical protein